MAKEKAADFLLAGNPDFTVQASWNGLPTVLQTNQNLTIPQTPNGTTIFAANNQSTQNNSGSITLTSGGTLLPPIIAPFGTNAPTIFINNFNANNLSVTNTSVNSTTPILVQLIGPGIPGTTPGKLPIGPPGVILAPGATAQGDTQPRFMQLLIQSNSATLGVIGIIGGPLNSSGNNGFVISVNDSVNGNTGPGTGVNPPPGYYATTSSNNYAYSFNYGGGVVFVGNLSPSTADSVNIVLRAL
jgi:hypothetical protein